VVGDRHQGCRIPGSTRLGHAAPSRLVHIDVALQPRNAAGASAALKAISNSNSASYHRFLTTKQYRARYAPTAAGVAAVKGYLRAKGFTNVSALSSRLLITATGTVAQAQKAFHTSIASFRVGGHNVYGNTSAALVPPALARTVKSVIGLSNLPYVMPHPTRTTRKQAAGDPDPLISLSPKLFQNTYDAKGTPTGSRTRIALLAEGDTTGVLKDLRIAEAKNHLPRVKVTQVNVGPQGKDLSGQDEFDKDTQVSTAMAGTVKRLYLYNIATLVDSSIVADFGTFAAQHKATAMGRRCSPPRATTATAAPTSPPPASPAPSPAPTGRLRVSSPPQSGVRAC
jgi:subtilase family serine protease